MLPWDMLFCWGLMVDCCAWQERQRQQQQPQAAQPQPQHAVQSGVPVQQFHPPVPLPTTGMSGATVNGVPTMLAAQPLHARKSSDTALHV